MPRLISSFDFVIGLQRQRLSVSLFILSFLASVLMCLRLLGIYDGVCLLCACMVFRILGSGNEWRERGSQVLVPR